MDVVKPQPLPPVNLGATERIGRGVGHFFSGNAPVFNLVIRKLLIKNISNQAFFSGNASAAQELVKDSASISAERASKINFVLAWSFPDEGDFARGFGWRLEGDFSQQI